jgi:5'-nucleotidase
MKYGLMIITAAVLMQPSVSMARNIVISNDDGLTSNVMAVYRTLKAAGHDVIVSVPCTNQSGMGAALKVMRPLGPLAADCRSRAAKAGAPGAGPMTREGLGPDFYYVDGTPVMSLLYGLDVAAKARWGRAPDLVVSGPNEGSNLGQIVLTSGTVSNAQYAAARGIPAIATSGSDDAKDDAGLNNPKSASMAAGVVRLVAALDRRAGGKALLPPGVALNVNFPDHAEGAPWRLTRIGTYNLYTARFSENIGGGAQQQPGIAIEVNKAVPTLTQKDDESVQHKEAVTVSVMQAGYDAPLPARNSVRDILGEVLAK